MPEYRFDEIAILRNEKRTPVPEDKYTYVGLEHLDSGKLEVTRWGSEVDIKGEKLVMHKGDILFGRRNTYLKRAAIAPHDGLFSAHGMIFRPNTKVISERLFPFFIASDYFMDAAIRISVGSLSPTVNWKTLRELKFKLPPLGQQNELADLMQAANDTKVAYEQMLLQIDELVKSQFIEMFGDPTENPKGFEKHPLMNLATKITDGVHKKPVYTDKGKPFISVTNINKGVIDFTDCKFVSEEAYQTMIKTTFPEKGDVLYTKVGATYGIPAYVDTDQPFGLYVSVCLIKPKHDMIDARFLTESMRMEYVKKQADDRIKGIGVPDLHLQEIKAFEILCPPRKMQERFVSLVEQSDKSKHSYHIRKNTYEGSLCLTKQP